VPEQAWIHGPVWPDNLSQLLLCMLEINFSNSKRLAGSL